ncbi:glutaminyl-peptide cyclotransferase [Ilyomonas limi]|uniref:Glutaminyl-peptide cyclotransferase n=1 Tax=Ilyomonas limi TaxID=2575867 RepID=A0A4U3L6C1_9BACT|nr:glutaminyl-peptide cyclotransferase [Ilyomonas limi]TKK70778.1 glutaminyl-peptide cyclotransferase [Ilyomonas limi]
MKKFLAALSILLFVACNNNDTNSGNISVEDNSNPPPPAINYSVVKMYPHDTSFFTEGLIWHNDHLYESTGLENKSRLVKTDLNNGKIVQESKMLPTDFGEGIAILNGKIYQLTYQQHKVYVYDLTTFKKIQEFNWPYEGWGMTTDGKHLIISTGSSNLYIVNPDNFQIVNTVSVTNNYGPVGKINELEYVNGAIYANVWFENIILKIDPQSGQVVGQINLQNLVQNSGITLNDPNEDVLNGIAYDSTKDALYITGKRWPALFEIKLNKQH